MKEVDDELADEGATVGRAYVRGQRIADKVTKDLHDFVLRSAAKGHGFAVIARATGHVITPGRVRQIVVKFAEDGEK